MPLPVCDWTMTSRPAISGSKLRAWTGEGLLQPSLAIAWRRASGRASSSKEAGKGGSSGVGSALASAATAQALS